MKYRRLVFLAPLVALALLVFACSQPDVHPASLGNCIDPATCDPPTGDGSSRADAAKDGTPASDAKTDAADGGNASDASDAAKDAAKDGDADAS